MSADVDVRECRVLGTYGQAAYESGSGHVGILQAEIADGGAVQQSEKCLVPGGEVQLAGAERIVPIIKIRGACIPQVADGVAAAVEVSLEPVLSGIEAARIVLGVVIDQGIASYGSPQWLVLTGRSRVAKRDVGRETEVHPLERLVGICALGQTGQLGSRAYQIGGLGGAQALPLRVDRDAIPCLLRQDRQGKRYCHT